MLLKYHHFVFPDPTHSSVPTIVDNIADAVTHARFVGTDQSSDGVVLMKILEVLRTLTLSPEGSALTNDSICEIMLSCFRICFESRLNGINIYSTGSPIVYNIWYTFRTITQNCRTLPQRHGAAGFYAFATISRRYQDR